MSDVIDEGVLEFDMDISDAEKPPLFPIGWYPAEIKSASAGLSKSSGNRMVTFTTTISPDDYPADYPAEIEPDGKEFRLYIPATNKPKDKYRWRQICEAVGVTPSSELRMEDFFGKKWMVEVVHRQNSQTGEQEENLGMNVKPYKKGK